MARTFLTRLKVGTKLVDASAVATVYRRPTPTWPLWLLVLLLLAGVAATVVLSGDATPVGEWRDSGGRLRSPRPLGGLFVSGVRYQLLSLDGGRPRRSRSGWASAPGRSPRTPRPTTRRTTDRLTGHVERLDRARRPPRGRRPRRTRRSSRRWPPR